MTDPLDLDEHRRRKRVRGDDFILIDTIDDDKRAKKGAKRHAGDVVKAILYARDPIDKMFRRGTITRLQFDAGDALRCVHDAYLGAGKANYLNDAGGGAFGPSCITQKIVDAGIELDRTRRAMGKKWAILEHVVCHGNTVKLFAMVHGMTEPRAKRSLDRALNALAAHYGW
jgi:hypothetical protein